LLTIWLGRATMRPANGPDSNVSSAAKPDPEATSSGGIACSATGLFESAFGPVCCQTGMTEVASSNEPAWAGAPFPGGAGAVFVGQATRVELTSGVGRASRSARGRTSEAGTGSGRGVDGSATTGWGAGSGSGSDATTAGCDSASGTG